MSTISDEDIRTIALKLEAKINRAGWDQPAVLFAVHRRSDATVVRTLPFPIAGPPGEFVEWLGERYANPNELINELIDVAADDPSFYGFGFVSESWTNAALGYAEYQQWAQTGRRLADHPASQESRNLIMVTLWGQIVSVDRIRGEEPIDDPLVLLTGRIVIGLHQMALAIAAKTPPDRCDLAKLKEITPEPQEEVGRRIDSGEMLNG